MMQKGPDFTVMLRKAIFSINAINSRRFGPFVL